MIHKSFFGVCGKEACNTSQHRGAVSLPASLVAREFQHCDGGVYHPLLHPERSKEVSVLLPKGVLMKSFAGRYFCSACPQDRDMNQPGPGYEPARTCRVFIDILLIFYRWQHHTNHSHTTSDSGLLLVRSVCWDVLDPTEEVTRWKSFFLCGLWSSWAGTCASSPICFVGKF